MDNNHQSHHSVRGLTIGPEQWVPPADPSANADVLKLSACDHALIHNLDLRDPSGRQPRENWIDAVRGSELSITGCTFGAAGVAAITDPNSVFVDTYSSFTDATAARYLQASPHPNLAGHARLASTWIDALTTWAAA